MKNQVLDSDPAQANARKKRWEETTLKDSLEQFPERNQPFLSQSSDVIERLYVPQEIDSTYETELGFPGEYPYTRGIHATGYRGKPWTMRIFAGFGSAEETNERFKYLLQQGNMGLSVAFDLATLMGFDTDSPEAIGEYGKCGVAISSLQDMEILFADIPLGEITTSMTINSPAAPIWAFYIAAAEKQGWDRQDLRGTLQNDILKEFIAQKEFVFPPEPSMRLVTDTIQFASQEMPQWNSISISGYHIREAGSTALQELAFTIANGLEYTRWALARGLHIDDFAPRLSFFFNAHNDLFEEIAKYRAARRIWARLMRNTFGAENPRSWLMRFHTQTAGVSLTAQQPEVNVVRVALQALAAVLGGTQSLHTNSMDEALALPSEKAVTIAMRTQQVLLEESGVAHTIDPLGGSYYLESLTNRMEAGVYEYLRQIEEIGGVLPAIENGFFQQEIAHASYRHQRELDEKQRHIVGVNQHVIDAPLEIPILAMDEAGFRRQCARLQQLRMERDNERTASALQAVKTACEQQRNVMPALIQAAYADATLGEIMAVMREVFGEYQEPIAI
ncbi:MAG: methylmalonyl-CoA mutase family protein [Chloroflexi bacterium]|nr:methylmalonyl-CoA mutase family protein [Chloroflexota bacterium]